jgi:uracil-DNA glycosylase
VIVAVGVYPMRWCLRDRPDLGTVHGREFEVQIGDHKAVCVPIYHPSTYGRIERAEMGKADVLTVARVLRGLIA